MNKAFNFENINSIKILSLKTAIDNSFEAWYSHICRWYSRNFYTPLPQVEDMAPEVVLKTYYDDLFYKLVNSEAEEAKKAVKEEIERIVYYETRTKDDVEAEKEAEVEDDEWYAEELRKINEKFDKNKDNPNLIDSGKDKEFVEFDDDPPDFDED